MSLFPYSELTHTLFQNLLVDKQISKCYVQIIIFLIFILRPHPSVLKSTSWLDSKESLLEVLREPYGVPGFETQLTIYKASTLLLYYFSCPNIQIVLGQ